MSTLQNQLICKIERAKHDKEKLAIDLEREEECLTNSLQRQLSASKNEKEKTATEVVELKKQVEKMRSEQEQVRLSFLSFLSLYQIDIKIPSQLDFTLTSRIVNRLLGKLKRNKNYSRITSSRSFKSRYRKKQNWKISFPDQFQRETL